MVNLEDAYQAASSIVRKIRPVSVLLFGSVAREGFGADLDLLVITDKKPRGRFGFDLRLRSCLKEYYRKFDIDPFIVSQDKFREHIQSGSPFLRLIIKEGRTLYMRNAVKEWLKQARSEYETAGYLLKGGYFRSACYHAQQAAEKAMKARLLSKEWELEKTHSIERLNEIGKEYKISFRLTDKEMVFLDSIYRGRYPTEAGLLPFGEPAMSDAKKAVSLAKRLLSSAEGSIKKK